MDMVMETELRPRGFSLRVLQLKPSSQGPDQSANDGTV